MKVGLFPCGASGPSGTGASFSSMSLSVPLLIFSGNMELSRERSWGDREHGVMERKGRLWGPDIQGFGQ